MCGIAGAVNLHFSESNVLDAMLHRGPDEQGSYRHNNVQFFHLRLSILDIACGKQPMHLGDKYSIIFNGEIFNHQEIRKKFSLKAHTSSDTETILLLYEKFGQDFLHHLDGMFAFVINDKTNNTLFAARDREGSKPFYYYFDRHKFVFASELNGLSAILPLEINLDNFHSFLRFGSFFRELTPYKNVNELEPGHTLTVNCQSLHVRREQWWDIHSFYTQQSSDSHKDALEKTDAILRQSVKRRLETSDLDVGAFLSGGIDSGLVTAVASELKSKLKTFTVSFPGAYDEAPLARMVADRYETEHTEIRISFDHLEADIEKILANYGEPFFDSSAIPSYYVSKAAKEFVTVVLNGDGADELFGGYRRYVPFARFDFFKSSRVRQNTALAIARLLPPSDNKKSLYNYIYRLADFNSKKGIEMYLSAGVDIFEGFVNHFINVPENYMDKPQDVFNKINSTGGLSGLQKLMNLDFAINLPGDLLVKMDIATMANSQEGRSPFLCKEFLEYVPGLSDKLKIKGKTTKYLLRSLAKTYLPEQLLGQPKRGFEIPLKKWVNGELKELIYSYLNSSDTLHKGLIHPSFTTDLLDHRLKVSEEKRAKMIWTLFAMEVWYQRVYKHKA